ncbi:hypothetical protein E2C01_058892 [Portunus trituberculatus]|uniref:Uncharacterized protein n=1 Tax=Portunus trituberculatus TaxID=210409 RepID=A0A5B7GWR2_PORTR|nr:hypothetical protein [Portunus trituberculatus]
MVCQSARPSHKLDTHTHTHVKGCPQPQGMAPAGASGQLHPRRGAVDMKTQYLITATPDTPGPRTQAPDPRPQPLKAHGGRHSSGPLVTKQKPRTVESFE